MRERERGRERQRERQGEMREERRCLAMISQDMYPYVMGIDCTECVATGIKLRLCSYLVEF